MNWTSEQILAFAPDTTTAERGKRLGSARRWRGLAGNALLVWGECESSGTSYHRSLFDLQSTSYHCSCPSRKYPCKHIIGLLLLLVDDSEAFRISEEVPDWVSDWQERREKKMTEKAQDSQQKAEARARNRDKRLMRMAEGLKDLESWLMDLLRQGLAATEMLPYNFWQEMATRMTDMQLGGMSRRIRALPLLKGAYTDWPQRMLNQLAEMYLVARGFEQLEKLPPLLQQELLSIAGISTRKDELFALKGIEDDWAVIGLIEGVEENLNVRRVWLYGLKTKRTALILDFVHNSMDFEEQWRNGHLYSGELTYYPSSYPLRAIVKNRKSHPNLLTGMDGFPNIEAFRIAYATALTANPWLLDFPCLLKSVIPINNGQELLLVDQDRQYIPLQSNGIGSWQLMALAAGHPIDVFGEWTGNDFFPLSAVTNGRFVPF